MIKKPFIIYQSSAGSGKTYTLAKNYIRLSLKSKNYFKKILAVTFTNKAAEEMKIRILEMIDSISNGEEKDLILEFSKYYKISLPHPHHTLIDPLNFLISLNLQFEK